MTRIERCFLAVGVAVALFSSVATPVTAAVDARVVPMDTLVTPGSVFEVEIRADLSDPILGWGLDLGFDSTVLSLVGSPVIGPDWDPVASVDGDGLAGGVFPDGLAGDDLLLATLTFLAEMEGMSALALGVTQGDLSEGFALDPTGFDTFQFTDAVANVMVPEPGSGLLVAGSLGFLAVFRRRQG